MKKSNLILNHLWQAGRISALMLTAATGMVNTVQAQQKVNDGTIAVTAINPDAIAEYQTIKRGILLPRVALTATNIATPLTAHVAGMYVYNTATAGTAPNNVSPGTYYNDGTQWVRQLTTATNDWHITGNTGTTPPTATGTPAGAGNYWGTADAQNLAVGTNGTTRAIFDQNGSVYGGNSTYNAALIPANSLVWGKNNRDSASTSLMAGEDNALSATATNNALFGKGNYSSATGSVMGGNNNKNAATSSIVVGNNQTLTATANNSALFGDGNYSSGPGSLVGGVGNKDSALYSIVAGEGNILASGATKSAIFGYINTSSGSGSFIAGSDNKNAAGSTIIAGHNNIVTATANNSAVFGESNISSGTGNSLVAGSTNKDSAGASIVVGESNILSTAASKNAVFGFRNTSSAYASLLTGINNTSAAPYVLVAGDGNILTSTAGFDAVFGNINFSSGYASLVSGVNNKDSADNTAVIGSGNVIGSAAHHGMVLGDGNTVSHSYSMVFGRQGASTRNEQLTLRFANGVVLSPLPVYATDAAADADATLPSGALYKVTGSRAVLQKP